MTLGRFRVIGVGESDQVPFTRMSLQTEGGKEGGEERADRKEGGKERVEERKEGR